MVTRKTPAAKKSAPAPKPVATKTATATDNPAAPAPMKAAAPVPARPATVVTPMAAPGAKQDKASKPKKPKLVRDSFTIPKNEYVVLGDLKQKSGKLGQPVKKSELLRAGIKALAAMSDAALLAALKVVPALKTGRPAKA